MRVCRPFVSRSFAYVAALCAALGLAGCKSDLCSLDVDGFRRSYLLTVPTEGAPSGGYPVVLVFHQFLGTARGVRTVSGFDEFARREGFLAVYPNAVRRSWNVEQDGAPDDIAFVTALLDSLDAAFGLDRGRIFATGISNGGMFAQVLACETGAIAAVSAVAGSLPAGVVDTCRQAGVPPTPALLFHGTADSIVPFAGGNVPFQPSPEQAFLSAEAMAVFWAEANGCSVPPTETALPDLRDDRTTVVRLDYACEDDAGPVTLVRIEDGGHTWPGRKNLFPELVVGRTTFDIDATAEMWAFFESQTVD